MSYNIKLQGIAVCWKCSKKICTQAALSKKKTTEKWVIQQKEKPIRIFSSVKKVSSHSSDKHIEEEHNAI